MENNHEIRKNLIEAVASLTNEELNKKVREDEWSIMQVLDHLYLLESKIAKIMTRTFNQEHSELIPDKPIHITVDRSNKFNSPEFLIPTNEFVTFQEMKQKLTESRNALINFVNETKGNSLDDKGIPHPIFGQVNLKQWITLIGLHEKRHLEQINDIKKLL